MSTDELHQQAGYDFMGAAFEVYNELGSGFLEEVYLVNFGSFPRLEWERFVV